MSRRLGELMACLPVALPDMLAAFRSKACPCCAYRHNRREEVVAV
jgi:hypothetical protein